MTVKELCEALGVSTQSFFQNAYERYGRLYSIGNATETHARYLQAGVIPIFVARYKNDMEKVLLNHHRSQP